MTARHDKSPLIGVSDLGPSKLLRRRESKPIHKRRHHRRHRMRYVKWQMLIAVLMVGLVGLGMFELEKHEFQPILHRRRLSTNATCEPVAEPIDDSESKSIGEFPEDFFTNSQRRNGAVLVHVMVMVYMFSALAFVCDSFFESSLERIVEEFQITDDVAGATWMAAGGSAPELATSMIGALITKSDIGFGTIVGSAVFNVLFVIGACAFVVGNGLKLTAYPLARDSTWYTVCLIFIVLAVYDQKVHVWESAILFGLYCIYILIMKFNSKLSAWFAKHKSKYEIKPAEEVGHEKEAEEEEEEDDDEDFMAFPDGFVDRIIYVLVLPLKAFMVATIPDCNKKPKMYLVTFSMCVIHIALYSYVMVWMANAIGITLRIPDEVMGVTILAMGTSIPDALSSIAVARRGHGDMAVSSSIGSNIFDITVGLPIPWMLYSLKTAVTDSTDPPYVTIQSDTIGISVGTLLLMLLSTIASIHWNKWKLDTRLGYMLLGLYLIFFIETLVLFFVKDPECQ